MLHFNRQPTESACLSCVYPENEREHKHEENVAEALGLSVEEVRAGFISLSVASKICDKYADLRTDDLVGRAFDTVYKELCGVGKLKIVGGQGELSADPELKSLHNDPRFEALVAKARETISARKK